MQILGPEKKDAIRVGVPWAASLTTRLCQHGAPN